MKRSEVIQMHHVRVLYVNSAAVVSSSASRMAKGLILRGGRIVC